MSARRKRTSSHSIATTALTLLLLTSLGACAASPQDSSRASNLESSQLAPPPEPLANFTRFELRPATTSDAIRADAARLEVANTLESRIASRLTPVLEEWNAKRYSDRATRVLIIQPHIAQLRVIGGVNRALIGAFAGDSFIDLDLALIDESTGQPITTARIHREASAFVGGWSDGQSDRKLLDYVAAIARQYLLDNYTTN